MIVSHEHHGFRHQKLDAKLLAAADWDHFLWKLHQTDFWTLSEHGDDHGLDGEDWEIAIPSHSCRRGPMARRGASPRRQALRTTTPTRRMALHRASTASRSGTRRPAGLRHFCAWAPHGRISGQGKPVDHAELPGQGICD